MSEESIRRITERFTSQLVEACQQGRGKQILDDFFRAIAVDFATTTFLAMDEALAKATPDDGQKLWEWVQSFPEEQGLGLLASVTSTMEAFHGSAEEIDEAQQISALAYSDRLNTLFESSSAGGSA